ncbi:hypothetical protein R1flu_027383 [Riccia fluitans]|uniref:Uncharacterized protein n=1 Tax=Riccia fluitans TaxID=41844 RepID=A0ABD1XIM9_9MARC
MEMEARALTTASQLDFCQSKFHGPGWSSYKRRLLSLDYIILSRRAVEGELSLGLDLNFALQRTPWRTRKVLEATAQFLISSGLGGGTPSL